MNLLQDNVKKVYLKYLSAAFGSALISSIYGIVDMAVVGQYQGPTGTATLAVVAPLWNIIYSLGLLMGIGGSVLYATSKGRKEQAKADAIFTSALIGTVILALISWGVIALFDTSLFKLFGAQETLLPYAKCYIFPIKFVIPLFLFNQMLAAFLRNDNAPGLATKAVLAGGISNVFGDYFFVFSLDMGIRGAGIATALGSVITFVIMMSHFGSKKNTLRIVKPVGFLSHISKISLIGMSTFVVDVAMGVLTILFNRQILKYFGTTPLAVYGIIVNISTVVQCCAYSVGQAAQPLISINYGARNGERIKEVLKYALISAAGFAVVWTGLIWAFPNVFVRIFMTPTDAIYEVAPFILRTYGLSFILLPLNIFSTFYFQALMKPMASFSISVARGILVSGGLILLLPSIMAPESIWFAMPVTELVIAVVVVGLLIRYTKELPEKEKA